MTVEDSNQDSFKWSNLDHDSIENELKRLKSVIEREIKSSERLAPIPDRPEPGSFKNSRQAHSFELLQQERADDWVTRAYKIYCDNWTAKGGQKTQDFVLSVWCNALHHFVSDDVLNFLRLAFCVDEQTKRLLGREYGGLPQAHEAFARVQAVNRINENVRKLWQEKKIPQESVALKSRIVPPDAQGKSEHVNLLKVSDLAPVGPGAPIKPTVYDRTKEKNLILRWLADADQQTQQELLKELTKQQRAAKMLADLQGPQLALSVFGRTELEITNEIESLGLNHLPNELPSTSEDSAVLETALSAKGTEKLPQKQNDLAQYIDQAHLTDRQRECFSLRFEYGLTITAIAERLGINRKTVDEHLEAAQRNINQARERDKTNANKARTRSQD